LPPRTATVREPRETEEQNACNNGDPTISDKLVQWIPQQMCIYKARCVIAVDAGWPSYL